MEVQRRNPLLWLGIALVVALIIMAFFGALSMSTYGGYYGMMGSGSWGWGLLMMAVPGVILIVILLAALGGLNERPAGMAYAVAPPPSALEILDARYARGEINPDEYRTTREDLTKGPGQA